ncbi:IPExxxVDY family protein [Haoranjiania flava]|uniref:IPExxxVDY family protein n=1 Tax=Haoranjiania flava TaxID=1856322 RepID=A0AAE3IQG4_9BACT|nr:IPExxxVDY family protein [Haoranjiania flava]MCU7693932.1 IPExxxVDY family protein [Haoranjiania flava]
MAKLQTFSLNVDEMINDFFEGCRAYGIVTNFKNYKFCWYINKMLGYDFRLNTDIEIITSKKNRQYFFPVYQYNIQNSAVTHYLYDNSFDGEYLIPEFKHIDFLWLMKGEYYIDEEACNEIIEIVRSTKEVQMISEIDVDKLSSKAHLIF